ncbi:hypothetical protein GOL26_28775 [Sinorhizobium medicae]|nr:hypothetical protein [Sinorhizobium medicae]MDX0998868.1 hypothetical protein [Sinorhizobium medicae]MDX1182813.1 hypothetical protein [Sinorhizobium medicae]
MARRWQTKDFNEWMAWSGLSSPQAAVVLGVSERTVKRMRSGEVGIKDNIFMAAMGYATASAATTSSKDALLLGSYADQADWAALCSAFPLAHVTGMSSAIGRGWTSANSHNFRQLSQPERMPQPAKFEAFDLEWFPAWGLPWGVEQRLDEKGRPFRVASPERTLLELAVHEGHLGEDDVGEAYRGAFAFSDRAPDRSLLLTKAKERGVVVEDVVGMFLRNYAKV